MKRFYGIFIGLCMICMLIPFVCMSFAMTTETTENKTLSSMPEIMDGEKINVDYLSDMGAFFNDHFAFRQQMVSVNAAIYGKLFGASATSEVLIGTDGWLYYTGTLNDYTSEHLMTERGRINIVHNLKLMQEYVESHGSSFLFTIAPNKNSLYGEHMPYYYVKGAAANNYECLLPMLQEAGIHYADLFQAFRAEDEVLYFEKDSHWTNRGAALAYRTIMRELPLEDESYETYETVPFTVDQQHLGDLTKMLYPLNSELEENEIYQKDWIWSYVNDVHDNMDNWIQTSSTKNERRLLMFRDSFGESLIPFFAEEFGTAFFSRVVPYNLENVLLLSPDYVIVERVERRLSGLIESAPIMQLPTVELPKADAVETNTDLDIRLDHEYYVISGSLDEAYTDDNCEIYVSVTEDGKETVSYETFYISQNSEDGVDDYGFMLYLKNESITSDTIQFDVNVSMDDAIYSVASKKIEKSSP